MTIRTARVLAGLLLANLAFAACGYPTRGRVTEPGVYTCRAIGKPSHRLDTERADTLYFIGDGGGFEFVDLDTGEIVRLRERDGYTCERIEEDPAP